MTEHHPSEVPIGERHVDIQESGIIDLYATQLDGTGDRERFDLSKGSDLGRRASVHADYNLRQKVCSPADLALPSSVVNLIWLAIQDVSALTGRSAVDPRLHALEATLSTRNESDSMLESQVASKHRKVAAKRMLLSNLEGHVKIAEGQVSLRPAAIRELKAKLADAEAARYMVQDGFRSVEVRLETVNTLETSLREEVLCLQSKNSRLEDQCKLSVSHSSRAWDILDNVSEENRIFRESLFNLRAQYDQ